MTNGRGIKITSASSNHVSSRILSDLWHVRYYISDYICLTVCGTYSYSHAGEMKYNRFRSMGITGLHTDSLSDREASSSTQLPGLVFVTFQVLALDEVFNSCEQNESIA